MNEAAELELRDGHEDARQQEEAHELELERLAGILTALSNCRNAGVEEKQITILACELGVMDMWKRYA